MSALYEILSTLQCNSNNDLKQISSPLGTVPIVNIMLNCWYAPADPGKYTVYTRIHKRVERGGVEQT